MHSRLNKVSICQLESSYSAFEFDLFRFLGASVDRLVFNFGYFAYPHSGKNYIVSREIRNVDALKSDLDAVSSTPSLHESLFGDSNGSLLTKAKYRRWLINHFLVKEYQLVVMYNDLRWQHSIAIEVCKYLGVKYLVIERGIFRPTYTTFNFSGVNANALDNLKHLWLLKRNTSPSQELSYDDSCEGTHYTVRPQGELRIYARFLGFLVLSNFGRFLGFNCNVKNKNYKLLDYLKLYFRQKFILSRRRQGYSDLPEAYIFVPLQLGSDTQTLLHSEFDSTQDFITFVEQSYYTSAFYRRYELPLLFKIHPMDVQSDYDFDKRSLVSSYDTSKLVESAKHIVTINSTVGFEALSLGKSVVMLGRSFYSFDEFVFCGNKKTFPQILESLYKGEIKDFRNIDKFVDFLKHTYQVTGDVYNYDFKDLLQARRRILEVL